MKWSFEFVNKKRTVFYILSLRGIKEIKSVLDLCVGEAIEMANYIRIEFPDAWYHVKKRGRRGEAIFRDWLRNFRKWGSVDESDEVSERLNAKKWPVCLGPQAFINRIKERYGKEKISRDVPSSRELLPDYKRIVEDVCKAYRTTAAEILRMQRGKMNEARTAAIYLSRRLRRDTLKKVGLKLSSCH